MSDKPDDQYSPEEARRRLENALRGARIAGPMPLKVKKAKKAAKKTKTKKEVK